MKKEYLILILSFFLVQAVSKENHKKEDIKNYSEAFKLVEVWLDAQKDFDKLPGISAIVVDDQEVLWSGAFGLSNIKKKQITKVSTINSICSISKLFTSVAIMKLFDEGKLRLDDEINELLPYYNLKQYFPESGPITIRTLLTHSSGLPRESDFPYWVGPDFHFPTKEQVDSQLANQQTLYPASTYFQYSNLGLTLLGEIVEQVSGASFDNYIQDNILKPLSLKDTRTELPESKYGKELAVGYSSLTRKGDRQKVNFFQANGIKPAAGFSSNVTDLGKFASWQFRLRESKEAEILKPSTLKYMHNVHWTDPDWETTWGLGFAVYKGLNGNTWVGHGGDCPGYRSNLLLDLQNKRAYSVMINASGTEPGKYVNGIKYILSKVETIKQKETSDDKKSVHNLEQYVGFYNVMPWWSELYLATWNGKLVSIDLPSKLSKKSLKFYKHIKGDVFRRIRDDGELGETWTFERNNKGKVIQIKSHEHFYKKLR